MAVNADMLGDAASFPGHDIGFADRIEQGRLAVIDMAHDGDDGRARNRRAFFVRPVKKTFLDIGFGDAFDRMAQFLGDQLRGIGFDHVGDRRHLALFHQELDDVNRAFGHAVGELLNGDRLRQHDFARKLLLRLLEAVPFQALGAAPESGDRARALFLARRRAGDRQAAAIALFAAAGRPRRQDDFGWLHHHAWAADHPPRLFFLDDRRASARRSGGGGHGRRRGRDGTCRLARHRHRGRRGRFAASKAPARFVFGLAFEIGVLGATQFFVALARLGGFALDALARLALGAKLRLGFLPATILVFARAGADKRVGARLALFFGQCMQDDAGLWRRRRLRGRRLAGRATRRDGRGWRGRRGRRTQDDGRDRRGLADGRLTGARDAPLHHFFDDDRFASAMRKALADHPLFDRTLQMQGLRGGRAQSLFTSIVRIGHASFQVPGLCPSVGSASTDGSPPSSVMAAMGGLPAPFDRYWARRRTLYRNAALASPAPSAACITFVLPNAKSNWLEEKRFIRAIRSSAAPKRARAIRSSLAVPSADPSDA
jgi:hypothetical protein